MIERLPSGKWRVRLYSGGQYVAGQTFTLKREARDWEARQTLLLKSGTWTHPDDAAMRYSEWLDGWLALQGVARPRRRRRGSGRPGMHVVHSAACRCLRCLR